MQPSDRYLVRKAREGDRTAFEGLYNRYKRSIYNYICRLIGDRAVAEELAQETFIKAYEHIAAYKPTGKVSSWIYAIAGNLAKNELRARGYRKTISLEAQISSDEKLKLENVLKSDALKPDDIAENNELKEQIRKVMNMLPVHHKDILLLCDVQNLSYQDAAEILDCTVGAVASRLSRARAAFVKIFKENFDKRA